MTAPRPGEDLLTSIDLRIQYLAYRELKAAIRDQKARSGSMVVMDVMTGEVLAMASVRRNTETVQAEIGAANFAAVDSYEPGSVAKVFSISGVVDSGVANPTTEIDVPGTLTFDPTGKLVDATQTVNNFNPLGAAQGQSLKFNFGDPTSTGGTAGTLIDVLPSSRCRRRRGSG